jgi:hypothetical protein
MQRISVLPKEVQVSILMFAMEQTPTARIMKAAIDKASSYPNGEPCWWKKGAVSKDRGYQKYLNRYTHCHRLWARVLALREEGEEDDTIYWKWSETNVYVNKTGRAFVRGEWPDLEIEMNIRRDYCFCDHLCDQFVHAGSLGRPLHMHIPSSILEIEPSGDTNTYGYLVVSRNGTTELRWGSDAQERSEELDGVWQATRNATRATPLTEP